LNGRTLTATLTVLSLSLALLPPRLLLLLMLLLLLLTLSSVLGVRGTLLLSAIAGDPLGETPLPPTLSEGDGGSFRAVEGEPLRPAPCEGTAGRERRVLLPTVAPATWRRFESAMLAASLTHVVDAGTDCQGASSQRSLCARGGGKSAVLRCREGQVGQPGSREQEGGIRPPGTKPKMVAPTIIPGCAIGLLLLWSAVRQAAEVPDARVQRRDRCQ